jgi:SNF2 family DNA or RNA helicase
MDRNRFTIFQSLTLLRLLALDASLVDDEYAKVGSAKLDVLQEHLDALLPEGHRALVFSQFTSFLRMAADRLDAQGIKYAYLDGSTRRREEAINEFKDGDAPVFLISLKAGGFGLNLTEADYCFLLDPWWNPAAEAQAVDRAHRIGQTRNVMVYRLVSEGTIEEKVVALQDAKRELISSVMDGGDGFGSALTADDIRELLSE